MLLNELLDGPERFRLLDRIVSGTKYRIILSNIALSSTKIKGYIIWNQ